MPQLVLKEKVNVKRLKFIVQNGGNLTGMDGKPLQIAPESIEYARSMLSKIKPGKKFFQSKYNSDGGRQCASHSLQGCEWHIRQTISWDIYRDIDISNCHPTILRQICLRENIKCPLLSKLVTDRKATLERMGMTKKDVLKLMYDVSTQKFDSIHTTAFHDVK